MEFALNQLDRFDAIFWLHADDTTKLAKDFGDNSIALGLEKVAGDQAVSKDLVLEWLCRPHSRRSFVKRIAPDPKWLLIFDNADDLDVLVDYLPVSGNGSILVTSRDPLAKTQTYFRTTAGIDLISFSKTDTGMLLRTLTGYDRGESDIELSQEIAEKPSGLPLAISQIPAQSLVVTSLCRSSWISSTQTQFGSNCQISRRPHCCKRTSGENYLFCIGA